MEPKPSHANEQPLPKNLKVPQLESLGVYAELTKHEVLEALRTQGVEDPETKKVLDDWLDVQQKRAEQDPTHRVMVLLEIARADFYIAVGDIEEAFNCLDTACLQAFQEGHLDLYDKADMKISALSKVSHDLEKGV